MIDFCTFLRFLLRIVEECRTVGKSFVPIEENAYNTALRQFQTPPFVVFRDNKPLAKGAVCKSNISKKG